MSGDGGLLVQTIVYAGLEALRAAVPLDLAAYLHETPDQGPQLFLGAPTLADIDPTAAFNLFAALRGGLGSQRDGEELDVPGYRAIAITTGGAVSKGVHVLGRRASAPTPDERAGLVRLAHTFAALGHSVEQAPPGAAPANGDGLRRIAPVRVVVETVPGGAEATVTIDIDGRPVTQTAHASGTARAVATAAVACVDPSLKVVEAGEEQIGGARAVLALIAATDGRQMLGTSLIDDQTDSLRATSIAALDAAERLSR